MIEDGHSCILGPNSFKVIGLSNFQAQASTVVLTNNSCKCTIQPSIVVNVKIETNDDVVLLL